MRRLACVATASALMLFSFAAPAAAKGPSEATIFGPGMDGPTSLSGDAETGAPTEFGDLVDRSGFFFSLFRSPSSPITDRPPHGELGPQYTVEYVVPWRSHEYRIIQLLYPFAASGPVTFVDPAQDGLDEGGVHGGWYLASDRLLDTLVLLGVPNSAPAGLPSWAAWLAAAVAASAAGTVIARRRWRRLAATPEPA